MFTTLRKWYENKTFAKKILYSTIVFCIIPFVISIIFSSFFFLNILIERTNKNINDTNNTIAMLVGKRFSQCGYVVDNLIYDPTFLCLIRNEDVFLTPYESELYISECISEMQIAIPEIQEIIIYADTKYSGEVFHPLSSAAQNENLNYAVNQKFTTWYADEGNIYAAYPIIDLFLSNLLGIAVIRFDLEKLINEYTQLSFTEYGIYMYGPNSDNIYTKEVFPFEIGTITERMLNNGEEEKDLYIAGRPFINNHITISPYNINLYCIIPKNSVYNPIRKYLIIPLLVWAVCFLFIIYLYIFLSRSLSQRVRKLESQMTKFSNGDLTGFVPESINDEIGNISIFCSQAIARIKQLIDETYIAQIKFHQAKNDALVAQINPHFLYNTLNMIASYAILSDNTDIADLVTQLSNYYRTTLNKGQTLITIEDELLNVTSYCNLQLKLHDNKFTINYDTDKRVYHYKTINLCLQPLVENAIEHGINNLPENEGYINISSELCDNEILFTVINNGAPEYNIDPNTFLQKTSKGYGLKNIEDRIRIAFGDNYGLKLSCKGGIFKAVITIPTQITNPNIDNTDISI